MNKKAGVSMMTKVIIGLVIAVPLLLGMFKVSASVLGILFPGNNQQSVNYVFSNFVEYYGGCKEIEAEGCSCGPFNYEILSEDYKINLEQKEKGVWIKLFSKKEKRTIEEVLIKDNVLCAYYPLAKPEKRVKVLDEFEIEKRGKSRYPPKVVSYTHDGNIFLMKYNELYNCFLDTSSNLGNYNKFIEIVDCEVKKEETEEDMPGGFSDSKTVAEYFGNDENAKTIAIQISGSSDESRGDQKVEYIIMHHTVTPTLKGTLEVLRERARSSHYIVGKDGTIVYAVDESMSAWHGGCIKGKPPFGCLLDFNMNPRSIGIEIVNGVSIDRDTGENTDLYPPEQIEAVNKLVKYLIVKYKIPENNILGHGCVTRNKMAKEPVGFEPPEGAGWDIRRYGEHSLCFV